MAKRDIGFKKRRKEGELPPEKLLSILEGIYPDNVAKDLFDDLMNNNEEEQETN